MYAEQGNLVDADAFGAKASTKTHWITLIEVIQGYAFWDHWKVDEGLRITVK